MAEPWETRPDVLLAAVNAARVMPRAQVPRAALRRPCAAACALQERADQPDGNVLWGAEPAGAVLEVDGGACKLPAPPRRQEAATAGCLGQVFCCALRAVSLPFLQGAHAWRA